MTSENFFIPLTTIIEELHLERVLDSDNLDSINIVSSEINRPGLQLIGFFDYFDNSRIQILGKVEITYLRNLTHEERLYCFESILATKPPAIVITRSQEAFPELLIMAKKYNVPLLRTEESTSVFMSTLISELNVWLAQRITRHGVLVEVHGEGILLLGESGVGKSETAIELVKRGHRFVADDAVEIKKVSNKTLIGSAPDIIKHFIELRGIGIIDVKRIFGAGAVKDTEKINMVIHLEPWEEGKQYDRLGIVDEYTNILNVNVPSLTIPVRPGRNLAVIVEVAAMNNRQKRSGFNAAEELNRRIMSELENG